MRLVEWFNKLRASLNPNNISERAILMMLEATPFRVHHLYQVLRGLHALQKYELLPSEEDIKEWLRSGEVVN